MSNNIVTPKRALLVVDVQNEYVDGGFRIQYPPVSISLPNIVKIMDSAEEARDPIILVRHYAPEGVPIFAKGTNGFELHPQVANRHHDLLIDKTLPSCFAGTNLESFLKSKDINTLVIVGYMTHNCDATTIFEAHHRGYNVEFISDASGSLPYENKAGYASAEELHRVFSVVFQSNYASVSTTEEWLELSKKGTVLPVSNYLESNIAGLKKEQNNIKI
ncbi:isochorismatase hydrolase [Heterostelium album PN500]|uniref:Isochorismatase hydrolase n=1 Tax=Heterostelium pallidum (strain ATCC 26659 / Pp 5 / PN500) TaxID=670386 RepID=D3BQH4_HETP5|nr:isochorismatase hydrolase [Heterostelium album PN500]EFA76394.1 isochorismatase hydrolase [Heterostelium album PN500]|eukprot:XP_020428526.1 isochorismatase hydrolase [Heterostelium album PN500]